MSSIIRTVCDHSDCTDDARARKLRVDETYATVDLCDVHTAERLAALKAALTGVKWLTAEGQQSKSDSAAARAWAVAAGKVPAGQRGRLAADVLKAYEAHLASQTATPDATQEEAAAAPESDSE